MSSLGYFFAINIAFVSGQCQSDQQTLLLQLKSSLTFDPSSSVKLMQWRQSTDCCDWSGVDCDEAGHVIGLDLSTESISGGIENAAILFSLHYLRSLNLARTSFNGTQISSKLANISSLTYLNLSDAGFAGQIPVQISRMARLVALDFSFNQFSGSISSIRWEHLLNLVCAVLSDNSLDGSIPRSMFEFPMLQQLQLANNQFGGSIPRFSNASSSALDTQIKRVYSCLGLRTQKLTPLLLSSNNLNGTVQLDKILSLGNLAKLDLSYNSLAVDESSRNYSFSPMLELLNLASCKLREIPNLKNQSQLQYLYLSENQISREIPNWIWRVSVVGLHCLNLSHNFLVGFQAPYSIPALRFIDLISNQLRGNIHQLPNNPIYIDFSNNNFTSSIPADTGNFMPRLRYFCAANNGLTGIIPASLCNATTLSLLDLSNNSFMKKSDTLFVLNLQSNNLNESMAHFLTRFLEIVCYKLWISMEIDHKERSQNPLPNAKCWRF
ncbi:LRRNT 2 domain-containing protein [Citrus sinensis]|nr:LRRNT 2 domain-containing protein [Citrus sinensis]